jgi:hypothetical protein
LFVQFIIRSFFSQNLQNAQNSLFVRSACQPARRREAAGWLASHDFAIVLYVLIVL